MLTKIIVAGIGGVGGYFGGLLARCYVKSDAIEVHFIGRGSHLQEIRDQGLTVITRGEPQVVYPKSATDKPADIGKANYILICTKSYDLETMVRQLEPCIGEHTVLLPLLNGVDSINRINAILPSAEVWNGFAYLVARLRAPGVVDNFGNIQTIYFGKDDVEDDRMTTFEMLLRTAGIEATCSPAISKLMWEKFIFISPVATITSYLDADFGKLRADVHSMTDLKKLINEVIAVAQAKCILMDDDIFERTMRRVESLLPEATSSMHRDFQKDPERTELETLTGYVLREGRRLHNPVPTYNMMYEALKQKVNF